MDSHTGKRGPTSSQDNFIMQTSVPVSVTGQWGLSPWKQKVSLNGSLSENGSPLLGRGTWVWPSKFLSFLPFGSWLIPSVHHQEEKQPAFGQLSWSNCQHLSSSSGKEREEAERHRQPVYFRNHNTWVTILRQGAGTGFWNVHRYLPFTGETNAIQTERWDCQIVNDFMYFSYQCHRKTGDLGRTFCSFFRRKENC